MAIEAGSRPRLPRGVRLRRDEARGRWTLLAPERIFEVDAIVADLAGRYTAPAAVIEKDVVAMLSDLETKRVLET